MDAAAERGWASHAVSLRGHGGSGGHDRIRRWKLRDYTHDVMQAIADLPSQPVLVGHSMGGLVVRRVLVRYRAPAAVLVASAGARHGLSIAVRHVSRHPVSLLRIVAAQPIRLHDDDLFARDDPAADEVQRRLTPESPLAVMEIIMRPRPAVARSPLLVLHGSDDPLVPAVEAVRVARLYGARAHVFRGMGHELMLERGWRSPLAVMLDWLEETLGV
jgi:pimeloyl-ACP methyl ester carboxylesterase